MGRKKIAMQKIEDSTNRQVTFSKRKIGLLKKAYEISLLCEVDLALIMFSPGGKLTQFCKDDRFEEVFNRYISTSRQEKIKSKAENTEYARNKTDELNINRETEDDNMEILLEKLSEEMIAKEENYRRTSEGFEWESFSRIELQQYSQYLHTNKEEVEKLLEEVDKEINRRDGASLQAVEVESVSDAKRMKRSEDSAQASFAIGENFSREANCLGVQPVGVYPSVVHPVVDGRNRIDTKYLYQYSQPSFGASPSAANPSTDATESRHSQPSLGIYPNSMYRVFCGRNRTDPTEYGECSMAANHPVDSQIVGQSSHVDTRLLETGNSMGYTRSGQNSLQQGGQSNLDNAGTYKMYPFWEENLMHSTSASGMEYTATPLIPVIHSDESNQIPCPNLVQYNQTDDMSMGYNTNKGFNDYLGCVNNGLLSEGDVGQFDGTYPEPYMEMNDPSLILDNGLIEMNVHPGLSSMNPIDLTGSTQCFQRNHPILVPNPMDAGGVGQNNSTFHNSNRDHSSVVPNPMDAGGVGQNNPTYHNSNADHSGLVQSNPTDGSSLANQNPVDDSYHNSNADHSGLVQSNPTDGSSLANQNPVDDSNLG